MYETSGRDERDYLNWYRQFVNLLHRVTRGVPCIHMSGACGDTAVFQDLISMGGEQDT